MALPHRLFIGDQVCDVTGVNATDISNHAAILRNRYRGHLTRSRVRSQCDFSIKLNSQASVAVLLALKYIEQSINDLFCFNEISTRSVDPDCQFVV